MIEQTGNALVFYAHYIETKVGKTGLTVTVDVYRNSSIIVTGTSATEVGGGLYKYQLASGSNNAEGEYIAIFKTATSTVDQREIAALWVINKAGVENLDTPITSRQPSGVVVVSSNLDKTGYSLSSPQSFNISGTITNVVNVINPVTVSGSVVSVTNPVTVGTNNDKTGYSLSSPQSFNLIGNISGTLTNVLNVVNNVTGSSSVSDSDMSTIAGRVWNSTYAPVRTLTTSAGDSIPPAAGDDVFAIRGDTFIWDVSGLDLNNLSKVQFTVKKKVNDADSESLIFSESGTGLLYIDGTAAQVPSNSAITYNSTSGTARIRVEAVEMAKIDVAQSLYDIQIIRTTGTMVSSPVQGNFYITWDATRATS